MSEHLPLPPLTEILGDIDDDTWFQMLCETPETPSRRGVTLPALPPEQFQVSTVGAAGPAALHEGFRFYREIKQFAARAGRPIHRDSRILDFGCGWGRVVRFFLKDVASARLYGTDVDPQMTDLCSELIGYGNYLPCRAEPPIGLPRGFFDAIVAYSVFSHLSERVASLWVRELVESLVPGGQLLVTTRSARFIDHCRALDPAAGGSPYLQWLAAAFETDDHQARYHRGQHVFLAYPADLARLGADYGEALVPRRFAEERWTHGARLVSFLDDAQRLEQALIVLERD